MSALHSLLASLGRLSSGGAADRNSGSGGTVCQLDADHFRIIGSGRSQDADGIICFVEMGVDKIFVDHRIESNAENNKISFEVESSQLKAALKSILSKGEEEITAHAAERYAVLKLAKRSNAPCLCLDACSSGSGAKIQVHHAIPLRLLRPEEFLNALPSSEIPAPTVQLEIPPDLPIATVVDRLKAVNTSSGLSGMNKACTIYLHASMQGDLDIAYNCDGSSLKTYFRHLTPRPEGCADATQEQAAATLKLDTRKLSASLAWPTPLVSSALLCLVENEVLVVHVRLRRNVGTMTYYVPVHYYESDEHPLENND